MYFSANCIIPSVITRMLANSLAVPERQIDHEIAADLKRDVRLPERAEALQRGILARLC